METLTRIAIAVGACGVVFAAMTGVWYLSYRRERRRRLAYLARLRQERPDATREQFVAWFVERGARSAVAATVYDVLQRRCGAPDFPLAPDDPLERVCDVVVHEELDDLLYEMGYPELEDNIWDMLDWDALGLPPPSEPDAPIASLVWLVDALDARRDPTPETPAGGAI